MDIKQYEVVLVNLDPTIGSEIRKTRPCLVISPDEMNRYLRTIVLAPLTSISKPYPTRVEIKEPNVEGWIVLDQIRTVDRKRVIRKLGTINAEEIKSVKSILQETYIA